MKGRPPLVAGETLPEGYPLDMGMPFPEVSTWWQAVVRVQVGAAETWCANPDDTSGSSDSELDVDGEDTGSEDESMRKKDTV